MTELKTCPFCGSDARVRYKMPFSWVECKGKNCKYHTPPFSDWYEQGDGKDEAIEYWNKENDND